MKYLIINLKDLHPDFDIIKALRKNSYEIINFLCKTKPIFCVISPKTPISRKNKPNSNPIQSQFNPKQTQFKPISNPNKPNFTTLKGAKTKPIQAPFFHAFTSLTIMNLTAIFKSLNRKRKNVKIDKRIIS